MEVCVGKGRERLKTRKWWSIPGFSLFPKCFQKAFFLRDVKRHCCEVEGYNSLTHNPNF